MNHQALCSVLTKHKGKGRSEGRMGCLPFLNLADGLSVSTSLWPTNEADGTSSASLDGPNDANDQLLN